MKNNKNQQILIGGAVIFRDNRGKRQFLIVKQKAENDWELPKVTVRKGESSVRATIRLISEQAMMSVRILEEAGRFTGSTIVNGKTVPQKFFYYLMIQKSGGVDVLGFDDFKWVEYSDAYKKIALKREKEMIKGGKDALKEWEKTHNKKQVIF